MKYDITQTTIDYVLEHGITIDINIYHNDFTNVAANYEPDEVIRKVDNIDEEMKYKYFLSKLKKIFKDDFGYDIISDKYSNRENSISKYFWLKKSFDRGKFIRFPVYIKITDHTFEDGDAAVQEKYVVDKINQLSGYIPPKWAKNKCNPNSSRNTIDIMNRQFYTYPEAEDYVRDLLTLIDIDANKAYINQYIGYIEPKVCRNGSRYALYFQGHEVESFDNIDEYIIRILELDLVDPTYYDYTLFTFDTHIHKSSRDIYKTKEYRRYSGEMIL